MRIHAHSQFEEEERFYWRGWLYIGSRFQIAVDFLLFKNDLAISAGRGEHSLKFHVAIPYLFSFYIKFDGILPSGYPRELSLKVHGNALWWSLWCDPWGDTRPTPRWRDSCFHFDTFFLGKSTCTRTTLEERDVLIPMPEKAYPAHAKIELFEWSRPRWFTRRMKRCHIDVPGGIPHEGKGENSWDCGVDATYGITTGECKTIAQGVGILVGHVLHDRVRYGGYDDWNWTKATT